jgi:hypothetical protein
MQVAQEYWQESEAGGVTGTKSSAVSAILGVGFPPARLLELLVLAERY